jgi:NAD(P)-dependent dehydrogenase (short-subunit alcohol dehydrogenase family)
MSDQHAVAIVTGAGAGIGKACAVCQGAHIVVVDLSEADGGPGRSAHVTWGQPSSVMPMSR